MGFDGENYLVVWEDTRWAQGADLYAARVSQTGQLLDGSGFEIASADNESQPVVAFNGENYLVAWGELRLINGEPT